MNLFVINIKPSNWEECEKNLIMGLRKGSNHPNFAKGDIFFVRISGGRPDYGVKAIWAFESEKKVESPSEVPWTDAEYEWVQYFSKLVEFDTLFNEEFEGKSKYSEKIKMNAARLIGSVTKLRENEIVNYVTPLLIEKGNELKVNVSYLESQTSAYDLLRKLVDTARAVSKKIELKPSKANAVKDYVGDPINFRGIVYAPMNEAGVILLFSKVMEDLGIFYEASPSVSFPDMIGRIKTENGLRRIYIEFEYQSRNFVQHGHLEKMEKEGFPCDYIVCWENNWPECPIEVIELSEVIQQLSAS